MLARLDYARPAEVDELTGFGRIAQSNDSTSRSAVRGGELVDTAVHSSGVVLAQDHDLSFHDLSRATIVAAAVRRITGSASHYFRKSPMFDTADLIGRVN
jgi:ectoine hydroxylase-related dioxygenase (phytanoyl-CoA dioxygenase family)